MIRIKFCTALFAALLLALPAAAPAQAANTALAAHHMIASANPYASKAGLEMLRAGGSAVDAAIAAQMVLTLVEPESSGIGGGAFMMLYDAKTKTMTSFDGREIAPKSATPGMFLDANGKPRPHLDAVPGGLSVGVPGVVAMLEMAHKKYGKLPWAKLFQPAIKLAEDGVPVGKKLAATIRQFAAMKKMPDIRAYFYHKDGTPLNEGEILKNPALAQTLRIIAKDGAKAFYHGAIAQAIVDKVQNAPVNKGGMTLADLAAYKPVERKPVCGPYRTYRICSMGPPSSGGIAIVQILGMLQHFPKSDLKAQSLSKVHLFTQASRLAYADRAKFLGDPAFIDVPVKGLINQDYIASRAKLIDPKKDMGEATAGNPPTDHADLYAPERSRQLPGTSHMSIVDDNGQVVSMTTTVEYVFGSEMMAKGFFLNNQLTDFSFDPTLDGKPVANAPEPGKRPMSAMSPTIAFNKDGSFKLATGSPGGPFIIEYVAQDISAMLDDGLSPQAAAALPHYGNLNSPTILEKGTALMKLAPALKAMGHTVVPYTLKSGIHTVEAVKGGYIGGADPRRDGVALGD